MDSPENTKSAPKSPPDSPIYQYVSSLSPLKPVNAKQGVLAYENVDVPSPQLVFKTPNYSRQRSFDLQERSGHLPVTGSENLSPGYAGNSIHLSENMDVQGPSVSPPMSQLISCNLKECGNANPSPDQPTVSPSSYVAAYLADPIESGDNLSSSPDFCVKRTVKDIQACNTTTDKNKMKCDKVDPGEVRCTLPVNELVGDCSKNLTPAVLHDHDTTGNKESIETNCKKDESNKDVESLSALCQNEEHLGKVPITGVSLTSPENPKDLQISEENFNTNGVSIGEQLGLLPKDDDVNSSSLLILASGTQQLNVLNPHAVQLPVASISKDRDLASYGKENFSTSISSQGPQDLNLITSTAVQQMLDSTPQLHLDSHIIEERVSHVDNLRLTDSGSIGKQISYDQEDGAQHQHGKRKRLQFEAAKNLSLSAGFSSNSCSLTLEDSDAESPAFPFEVETANDCHAEPIAVSNSKPTIESVPGSFLCRLPAEVNISGGFQGSSHGTVPRPSGIGLHLNSMVSSGSMVCNTNMQMPPREASAQEKCLVEQNEQEHQSHRRILVPNLSVNYQSPMPVKPLKKSLPSKLNDLCITPCNMRRTSSEEVRSGDSTQNSPRKRRKKAPENEGHKRCNFHETRQQVESRNPLAFAPKVVVRVVDPPKDAGDCKPITPLSARHKRGCNCKKSLCLKRYCECYQAGVGCSFGCRCEGCKNTFGTKDGCGAISEMVVEHKRLETSLERNLSGELENIEIRRELANTKQSHSRLSPITPSIQTSFGSNVPKLQVPASYSPSPPYESFTTSSDSIQCGAFDKERGGSSALIPYELDIEYQNAGDVNPFSPGWEGFPEICNLSPLLKTPKAGGSSSASKTPGRKILQTKMFLGSGTGNLCLRSSPVTPLPRFGESKFVREPNSDNVLHGNPEDDTPEILKDACPPIKTVKATSPNQKRVSPPHVVINEARSSSPSATRSFRKYILQSVPAFPLLTPYSDNTRGYAA